MDDVYRNIEENHPNKKRKISIVFKYTIPDMHSDKKLNPIVTKFYITR